MVTGSLLPRWSGTVRSWIGPASAAPDPASATTA